MPFLSADKTAVGQCNYSNCFVCNGNLANLVGPTLGLQTWIKVNSDFPRGSLTAIGRDLRIFAAVVSIVRRAHFTQWAKRKVGRPHECGWVHWKNSARMSSMQMSSESLKETRPGFPSRRGWGTTGAWPSLRLYLESNDPFAWPHSSWQRHGNRPRRTSKSHQ